GTGRAIATAEIYDPTANTWSAAGPVMVARAGHTASLLQNGTVLIAGGDNSGNPQNSLEIFDPAAGTNGAFTLAASSLSLPRESHAAAVLQDGRVLIAGGVDGAKALGTCGIHE